MKLNTELCCQSNPSKDLVTLKSKYPSVHEPLPISAYSTPDDQRYLISLYVFEDREDDEPDSPLPHSFSDFMVDQNIIDLHIKEKIASVLKVLKFREEHVLVQFWSPVVVKRRWVLTTWDQPFGLGKYDEKLYSYRLKSELCAIVVDGAHGEKLGPPARVFNQKLPEWSLDERGLDTSYNIHGYVNLPVFESSGDCVGVLEIITSTSYVDFAFEVQQVSKALKNQNLKSPNVLENPSYSVSGASSNLISSLTHSVGELQIADENRELELDQIYNVLKTVCDKHNLPLAHTWATSAYSSYVANSETLDHSCNSFNRSCIGKTCISTFNLPFCVRDLSKWGFHEACKEKHLDKSQGIVGKSLSSRGTWFCKDVTKLDENDYPLVHNARMNGITSCLAIYLKSLEPFVELVVEFFLQQDNANESLIRKVMEAVNQQIKNSSWVELDILSPPQVVGEISLNWKFESPSSPVNLLTDKEAVSPPESENMEIEPSNNFVFGETSQSVVPYIENPMENSDKIPIKIKRKRKRRERSIGLNEISKHFGMTMDEAAAILKVSRSTLKRICRNLGIPRWPNKNVPEKNDSGANMKSDHTDVVVHKSEGSLTPTPVFGTSNEPIGGTKYKNNRDPVGLTANGKHRQHEQANPPVKSVQPAIKGDDFETMEDVTIKVTYEKNMVKFTYRLSDGLEKLKEYVATRFQLKVGSFRLKYLDEDNDLIVIYCDNDLILSLGAFRQPESKTVLKLIVDLVANS